jgi:Putative Flp pilus-assembly TadE/G-like
MGMRQFYHSYPHRRPAHGQAMALFAIGITVLLMVVGLSLDGLRVYISLGEAQRAADAAALAGVVYLPGYPTPANAAPDGNDATTRALQEAAKNGFSDASRISVQSQIGPPSILTVSIHIDVALSLVSMIDTLPISNVATGRAQMLPPLALGDGSNTFGDASVNNVSAGIMGTNALKEQGDAYSVYCEDGWSNASETAHADATVGTPYTTRLGLMTNVPQYPGGSHCSPANPGNSDIVPSGYGGLETRSTVPSGTSYLITLPPGSGSYTVWVRNPRFVYGASTGDTFYTTENIFHGWWCCSSTAYDNPAFYDHVAYSLFHVPLLYNRQQDVPVAALWPYTTSPTTSPNAPLASNQWLSLPPLDADYWDKYFHGCNGAWSLQGANSYNNPFYYGNGFGCLNSLPSDVGQWVQMPGTYHADNTIQSYYRLTVDTDSGYGWHPYSVSVCAAGKTPPNCSSGGATLTAWNAAPTKLSGSSNTGSFPLITIPKMYAGRTISLGLFNPGRGTDTVKLTIVPPTGSNGSVRYPSYARTVTSNGVTSLETSLYGDNLYHGKWVTVTLTLPANYQGGTWYLNRSATSSTPTGVMTVSASLNGGPATLVSQSS